MDTNIIINGVVIQSEWVEAIENEMMMRGSFTKSRLAVRALETGCPFSDGTDMALADQCLKVWRKRGRIAKVNNIRYRLATPAETEAHNRKMSGGVAK